MNMYVLNYKKVQKITANQRLESIFEKSDKYDNR